MTKGRERCRACLILKNAHFEVYWGVRTRKRVAKAARRDCKRCSVGNETAGRSWAWRAWCCVEWRERREERSVVEERTTAGVLRKVLRPELATRCAFASAQRTDQNAASETNEETRTEHCNHSTPQPTSPQSGETETKRRRKTEACRSGKTNDYLDTRDKHLNIGAHCRDCGWATFGGLPLIERDKITRKY